MAESSDSAGRLRYGESIGSAQSKPGPIAKPPGRPTALDASQEGLQTQRQRFAARALYSLTACVALRSPQTHSQGAASDTACVISRRRVPPETGPARWSHSARRASSNVGFSRRDARVVSNSPPRPARGSRSRNDPDMIKSREVGPTDTIGLPPKRHSEHRPARSPTAFSNRRCEIRDPDHGRDRNPLHGSRYGFDTGKRAVSPSPVSRTRLPIIGQTARPLPHPSPPFRWRDGSGVLRANNQASGIADWMRRSEDRSSSSYPRSSARRPRARLTRLFTVPTLQPMMVAASS
ncbi:UNVERIFIED_ORG: hypothetical protein M2438_001811 [Methylobacterium sp. SuP10 SLI 274]|nr:hypothetical protein [Methylorubrum extorquens]MDF9863025.1 hypothetical protein [Methylorubrum pseudosasae]MDH6636636.1 hypothetical protein [Methylobacterium sp. SuP10 SLI 274]MDH6665815.1 hypothetical protein [Methylorubrum zatmanii]